MEDERIRVYANPDLADDIPWYLGQVKEYTEAIAASLEQADFEAIRDIGHRMKGSGASFGFADISELGRSLEQAAREENRADIQKKHHDLIRYLSLVDVVYE